MQVIEPEVLLLVLHIVGPQTRRIEGKEKKARHNQGDCTLHIPFYIGMFY
jgi:hypothetical protein